MKEFIAIFSPQLWTLKNRLLRSGRGAYVKSLFVLLMGTGFWFIALHFLPTLLTRLQGMDGNVGNIIALKGISLLLMIIFFLLIFSSLLVSINDFYLSPDLPVILSSPVSWDNIYLSKWLGTFIKSSWMIIFAVLPVFIALGLSYKASAGYYLFLFPVLLMFVLIPSGIGVCIGIFLMGIVPAKRAKNIFIFLGLLILVIIFLLFRFLRPERFANPEWFANLTIFISEMRMPGAVLLPSTWVAETLTPFFIAQGGTPLFFMLLLLFTSCVSIIFGSMLFNSFYYKGLVKSQQTHKPWLMSSEAPQKGLGDYLSLRFIFSKCLRIFLFFFRGSRGALAEKDILTFIRNVGQSSQVLLLFAITVIYLFSIKALPVEWGSIVSLKLRYIISFFNIGLVGFVVSAVATRLVLPSVGSEGRAFWIIRVSPLSMRQFLWNKFFTAFLPLIILAGGLIVISNIFLGVNTWFMALSISTCLILVASITGLAVGIGAYNTGFSVEDANKEQSGFQGTAFMLSSFAVIIMTILLEIIPASGLFMKEISRSALTFKGWSMIGLLFLSVVVLNVMVLWTAMRIGEKRLVSME
jgi:ABC-2 type transport system permease protein